MKRRPLSTSGPLRSPRRTGRAPLRPEIAAAGPDRRVTFAGGTVEVSTAGWPVLGPPDAPHVIALLFDYTCAGCRHLRRLLAEALPTFGDRFALVLIPVPLGADCNPNVTIRQASHPSACAFARLGLTVWANWRSCYPDFDRYVFERTEAKDDEPPPIGMACREVERLTRASDLTPRRPDDHLDPVIARGLAIHADLGRRTFPVLLLHRGVLNGHVPTVNDLLPVLREQVA